MNEIEIAVTGNPKDGVAAVDAMVKAAQQGGKAIGADLAKGFDTAESAAKSAGKGSEKALDGVADKAAAVGKAIEKEIGDGAEKAGKSSSDKVGAALDVGFGKAATSALGAGAAVGGALIAGIGEVLEEGKVGGLLAAQLGGGAAAAAELGATAGRIYADNFGESVAQVGEAITALRQTKLVDTDTPSADLERLAGKALTTAEAISEDVGALSRSVSQMLRTGLARDADEALDMLTKASQDGLNVAGDLLDTVDEYSTQFRVMGLEGSAAFGLLGQAVQGGARDIDTAADAIKEFAIRSIDGSDTTAAGFRAIGLDAGKMADEIAAGGGRAQAALDLTLDKLRAMPDPVDRSAAAVHLFGTKAEDLGEALYAMDVSKATEDFGKFKGAVDEAAEAMASTDSAKIESAWRNITDGASNATAAVLDFADWGSSFKDEVTAMSQKAKEHADAQAEVERETKKATSTLSEQAVALKDLQERHREVADAVRDGRDAQRDYEQAIDDADQSMKDNGTSLDIHTEAGRRNEQALDDLAAATFELMDSQRENGATTQQLQGIMAAGRDEFVRVAGAMLGSKTQAEELANKLRLIPGNYQANVSADTSAARASVADLNRYIASTLRLTQQTVMGFFPFGKASGGPTVSHAAVGGARGGLVVKDEQGPELTRLPDGSTVVPAGMSQQLMSGGGIGGVQRIEIVFTSGGSATDDLMLEWARRTVKINGGNVQAVFGS